jgi:hypothetical protein
MAEHGEKFILGPVGRLCLAPRRFRLGVQPRVVQRERGALPE